MEVAFFAWREVGGGFYLVWFDLGVGWIGKKA